MAANEEALLALLSARPSGRVSCALPISTFVAIAVHASLRRVPSHKVLPDEVAAALDRCILLSLSGDDAANAGHIYAATNVAVPQPAVVRLVAHKISITGPRVRAMRPSRPSVRRVGSAPYGNAGRAASL